VRLYLAGSSAEITRAERWSKALADAGVVVTSAWIANITQAGAANPPEAPQAQREAWASHCLTQISNSGWFWLLNPYGPSCGAANPPEAPQAQREAWASHCLTQISNSGWFWLLNPYGPSCGAFAELGFAWAQRKTIVVSGGTPGLSIFGALGTEFHADQEAYDLVLHHAGERRC